MAERVWTQKQKQAIDTRDRTLLVSAAAGSGKTATLTERVICSLMDEKNPISVDSLLVVTFTNAAAAELRVKISRALEEAVEKNPENKLLARQLFMLPEAKIRTIDSFCGDILRSNADRVGVPFNYRIGDTSECELLALSIMDGIIEAVYSGELPEIASALEFEELADCLTDSKNTEELSEVFRYVFEMCESNEEGIESLLGFAEIYNPEKYTDVKSSLYGRYLFDMVSGMAEHYLSVMRSYKNRFDPETKDGKKYFDLVMLDIEYISRLLDAGDYTELASRIGSLKLERRPTPKEPSADTDGYGALRDAFKAELKKLVPFFAYTEEEWAKLYASLYRLTLLLYRFLKKFAELYDKEKIRRGILSYADVERYAYKCLIKDGERTDIAQNLRNSYSAIYIDEYQDVNPLQNSIFEAISKDDNRFMVGDIKQSIYGFRSARPEIFADMKKRFSSFDKAGAGECTSIFMSDNFRCDKAVVDFVNTVFDRAFALLGDSMGYLPEDALVYSKIQKNGEPEYIFPEVCLVDKLYTADPDEEDVGAADIVAAKIKQLISEGTLSDGSPVKPGDIAILMRSVRGKDVIYAEALERAGVPVKISGAKNFFLSAEVLLALCLLNSIDNPRRDTYLAGLMCSPLYGFSADELFLIKKDSADTLYDALCTYTEKNPEFEKGKKILCDIERYRSIAEGITISELLFRLYHETGLLALASKCGGKENLMLLYDYACGFSAGEFSGLYNFIHFIDSLIDRRTTFDDTRESSESDAVKIVTCHASKGLEYPIVFLVEAGARINNNSDSKRRIAYSGKMGIATRLRTPSGLSVVNNPIVDIINHSNKRADFEEDLRVLYVALTRARERLFVIGKSPKQDTDAYIEELHTEGENLSSHSLHNLSSYMEIIIATTGKRPLRAEEFLGGNAVFCESVFEEESGLEELENVGNSELEEELYRRFTYKYPRVHLTTLPEKISVSKAFPTVLDGTEEGVFEISYGKDEDTKIYTPAFISGSAADESAKRGIATHLFMQFCDLENFKAAGAKEELLRLVKSGYISEGDGERVRTDELEAFRKSRLFEEMLSAKKLYRELRFNVRLPAENFTEDDEKREAYSGRSVLVQGVIDCIIEYPDGSLGLFDYKTDRLPADVREHRALAEALLREKHKTQLTYYSFAAEEMFGKKPKTIALYSLCLGDTVII